MSRNMFVDFVNQMMVKVLVPRYRLARNPLYSRGRQTFYSTGQKINIFGFAGLQDVVKSKVFDVCFDSFVIF
jgi:hypothetical protein